MGLHYKVRRVGPRSFTASAVPSADPLAARFTASELQRLREIIDDDEGAAIRRELAWADVQPTITADDIRGAVEHALRMRERVEEPTPKPKAKAKRTRARGPVPDPNAAWAQGCPVCLSDAARALAARWAAFNLSTGRPLGASLGLVEQLEALGISATDTLRHMREHLGRKPPG